MEPAPDFAIDYEKLKIQEKILFFDEVSRLFFSILRIFKTNLILQIVLYEDELDDNGCAKLSVKMRAMPSGIHVIMITPYIGCINKIESK